MSAAPVDLSGFSDAALDPNLDFFGSGTVFDPGALSEIPLAGQLDGVPGGGGSGDPLNYGGFYSGDPSGMWGVAAAPATNPNPTGGWMQQAASVLQLASTGFKAFSQGSPSVSIPRPAAPGTGILKTLTPTATGVAGFKWSTIAIIGGGVIVLAVLLKMA